MIDRFYYHGPFQEKCQITESEFHHLIHVLRYEIGDPIQLVNGLGEIADGKIEKIEKNAAIISIIKSNQFPKLFPQFIVTLPILRMDRLEWALEKSTELGADSFRLFQAEYSEKKQINEHQLDRLRLITIAALKQCNRLYLPSIELFSSLENAFLLNTLTIFGDTDPNALPLSTIPDQSPIQLITGPEKGFSKNELAFLKSRATGVKLHPNILRAETAPLVGLSLLSQKWLS